jgi:hypothetical protein
MPMPFTSQFLPRCHDNGTVSEHGFVIQLKQAECFQNMAFMRAFCVSVGAARSEPLNGSKQLVFIK